MMLVHMLRSISGTNEKKRFLKQYADESHLKMFLYAYDPDKVYGIKFGAINSQTLKEPSTCMFWLLDDVLNGTLKGDKARDAVQKYSEINGDLIKLICNKDLDCGITATTINAVFGKGTIPTFNLQLAKEEEIAKVKLPVYGQIKYNGVRIAALVDKNGDVLLKTRNGKIIGFPALEQILSKLGKSYMLDGELAFGDSKGHTHTTISGLVNSSMHGSPIVNNQVVYTIFDCMPLKEFYSTECDTPYDARFIEAANLVNNVIRHPKVALAETHVFTSHKDIEAKFIHTLAQGYEGLILKAPKHLYTFKRNKNWIKLKAVLDCDLKCIEIEEGSGKYEGQIGALVCAGKVQGKDIIVRVGSGLTDLQRSNKAWSHYIGKTIEIQYNDIIQDKTTGEWSLFLPRFIQERCDI